MGRGRYLSISQWKSTSLGVQETWLYLQLCPILLENLDRLFLSVWFLYGGLQSPLEGLNVGTQDQQHQHHPRACSKCKFSGPSPTSRVV